MKVEVLSCAEDEFAEAVDYYNLQSPGLGYEFAAQVKLSFDRISIHPNAWPVFSPRTRRCMVSRFPFGVLYQIRTDRILVLAIMHLRRDPKRWRNRTCKTE
jgi:plasmid stabilization system protein ParE